jgi:hypothetical protein
MENQDLMSELRDVLVNEPAERHSYFQMKYFIVGKEPTTQAKMWQCIREIKSRHDSLEAIELEIEDANDNLELIEININRDKAILDRKKSKGRSPTAIRISEINLRRIERQRLAAKKNIEALAKKRKCLQEEAKFFLLAFKSLRDVEPLLDYDDLKAQKQYWGEKLLQKINLKMLMQSHVDTELIETVLALPDDIPIKEQTLKNLDMRHKQMVEMKKHTETALANKQETDGN